jgi:hypothetical protein
VSTLFAAFLGYNPIEHLVGAGTVARLPAAQQAVLLGHGFFPSLITAPFRAGLHAALDFAIVASALAAAASWSRGTMYVHAEPGTDRSTTVGADPPPGVNGTRGEDAGPDGGSAGVVTPVGGALQDGR